MASCRLRNPVDFSQIVRVEHPVGRLDVLFDLHGLSGAADYARNDRLHRKPAHRKLEQRAAAGAAELLERYDEPNTISESPADVP